ncbi:unnamed protein product [Periconia digitata]|uniref:Uncharacterized protein n=1 Tax=Periconia digitata TaxID=1303443 RepID=A0A9W4ULG4_9PLEO|nr:unnamed protein product [Periconia digitata]
MPLRSRLRRAFTRTNSTEDSNAPSKPHGFHRPRKTKTDPLVYQPGEKMPPLKYRRPVAPEHKALLESFSWDKAWRHRSETSLYSPMGSRIPSRKSSYRSFSRRSMHRRSMSRSRGGDDGSAVDSGVGASLSDERPERLREGSDEEGDVTNAQPTDCPRAVVGLSRNPTEDPKRPRRKSSSIHESVKPSTSRPPTSDRNRRPSSSKRERDAPFSPEDLELALKKSNLEATKEESEHSKAATPKAVEENDATIKAVPAPVAQPPQAPESEKMEEHTDSVTGILYTDYEDCDDEYDEHDDDDDDDSEHWRMDYEREPRPRERMISFTSSSRQSFAKPLPSMLDV